MAPILLIANSGVQYISIPKAFTDRKAKTYKTQYEVALGSHVHTEVIGDQGEENNRKRCKDAAEILSDRSLLRRSSVWKDDDLIPLPMQGGKIWCAIAIRKSPENKPSNGDQNEAWYDVVLAVDTDFILADNSHGQDGLDKNSLNFPLKINADRPEFWDHPLLCRLYDQVVSEIPGTNPEDVEAELYMLSKFLETLQGQESVFSSIKVASFVSQGRCHPVDLVIDLGNSRTTAILIEPSRGGNRFANQWRLNLIPKSRAFTREMLPCPSEMAFMSHSFFPFARKDQAGRDLSTFRVLSPIVFGQSARDEMKLSSKGLDRRGMSSPKRYVWDSDVRAQTWIYSREPIEAPVSVDSIALAHINKIKPGDRPRQSGLTLIPDHPRSAGLILVILELLEQAYREANSVEYRERYLDHQIRRRIASVVIMNPSSMASEEALRMNQLVRRALEIWRDYRANPVKFYEGIPNPPVVEDRDDARPQFENPCDEGMSIQACFVYAECVRLYGRKAADMTDSLGRKRLRHRPEVPCPQASEKSIRIASIDIGGGTIDLSIADYRPVAGDVAGTESLFYVEQLFHDGYPSAGDDLVRQLLESVVFPCFIETCGLDRTNWNSAMSENARDPAVIALREKLVESVWIPFCHSILSHFENNSQSSFEKSIREVFNEPVVGRPRTGTASDLDELDEILGKTRGTLADTKVVVSPGKFEDEVKKCWGSTLKLACQVTGEYVCDLLLIGGRSATMPTVKSLLDLSSPVSPNRIRRLSDLVVGDWYPFPAKGRVSDAKTAAVVGCGIFYKAIAAQLDVQFSLIRDVNLVQQFLGIFLPGGDLRIESAIYPDHLEGNREQQQLSCVVQSSGVNMWIGLRRVSNDRAPCRPVYRICRTAEFQQKFDAFPTINPGQVEFQVRRGGENEEVQTFAKNSDFIHEGVEVVNGALKYRPGAGLEDQDWPDTPLKVTLQTIIDGTYWLDSGQFLPVVKPVEADE